MPHAARSTETAFDGWRLLALTYRALGGQLNLYAMTAGALNAQAAPGTVNYIPVQNAAVSFRIGAGRQTVAATLCQLRVPRPHRRGRPLRRDPRQRGGPEALGQGHQALRLLLVIAVLTLAVDAATKSLVTTLLAEGQLHGAAPGWGLRRVHNPRGSLVGLSTRAAVAALALLAAGLLTGAAIGRPDPVAAAGLGLVLGGAAGNVADRVRHGAVVDFVAAGPWPVFNLADAAMFVGVVLTVVGLG